MTILRPVAAVLGAVLALAAGCWLALVTGSVGTPGAARSTGHDAEWLGHAWVDGRRGPSDVAALARQLRGTSIRDVMVHAGPYADDGTLDPALRPRARWLVGALHRALPGVRVQAWLGDLVRPGYLDLGSARTRGRVLAGDRAVLADGFDGIHYDFEPVADGDPDYLTMLDATRRLTRSRHVLLSVSASHLQPAPGVAMLAAALPSHPGLWSGGYLHRVATRVDQVALMAYDSALWTQHTYTGYVRQQTVTALRSVPPDVALLIGTPAYHDENGTHHWRAETVAASLRGIRLALGDRTPRRNFGVALYVDFAASAADWASFRRDWA
ncbi:hypothetical protein [Actinocatenispora rupis]|uniref:Glycosyl hydrolases family 18 n=1 Tax=Actinocatenispora rupis TaxID=519421 RepID=A0A8J3JA71_9ACTN|nr:hypothetical protein [Actinocatenispora rupis]GID14680.1 hypothetical protein Aru02nite_55690 [Actinocatenispora rupis]